MKRKLLFAVGALVLALPLVFLHAQNAPVPNTAQVQLNQALYPLIPISATAGSGAAAVLTLPAPPGGQYNYVCSLALQLSQGTSTVQTNAVTSSTNFNGFALKYSMVATANTQYDWIAYWGTPATGCVKSAVAGTATTFTSPAPANAQLNWIATYFVAP